MVKKNKKLPILKKNELNLLLENLLKAGFQKSTNLTEQWNQYIEIRSILERVNSIETELRIKSTGGKNRSASIENFCKWAEQNGADFKGVKVTEFIGYELGLEAIKDFKKDDIFISVPKNMIFSLDTVDADITSEIPTIGLFTMSNVRLAFLLAVEKLNSNSFWKPYFDVLPEKYSTVMNFSPAEMGVLKGSCALAAALAQCKNIARQYAFINKFLQNITDEQSKLGQIKDRFTYDLYCWAVSTVMTRQNLIPSSDPEQTNPALIPLWDMANHMNGELTTGYDLENNCVQGGTLQDYKKGEQVFIFYGCRNNMDLLVHNGFIYADNQYDCVPIKLGLSQSDELLEDRTKLLEALGISISGDLFVLPQPIYISTKLLGFVRVFNMNKEQLTHWIGSDRAQDLLHVDCALETSLESKTWSFIQIRLTLLLRSFPTTLDDDVALLASHQGKGANKLGHVKSMLVHYRILEKRILSEALEYVKQRIKA